MQLEIAVYTENESQDVWGEIPDHRGVDVAYGEGEGDPAGNGEQHQHLASLEPGQNFFEGAPYLVWDWCEGSQSYNWNWSWQELVREWKGE